MNTTLIYFRKYLYVINAIFRIDIFEGTDVNKTNASK